MATKAKQHPIEKELAELLEIKRGSKDSDTAFAKKLHEAATECDPTVWEQLSDEAQAWVNAYTEAVDSKGELPGYDLSEPEEADAEEAEEAEADPDEDAGEGVEEAPKGRGRAAKPAKAKPAKEAAQKPRKGAEKPAAKAPAKAAKEAAPKPNGRSESARNGRAKAKNGTKVVGFTAPWRKILTDIGKKGDKGLTRAEVHALCEKHGASIEHARFVNCGYLERVERGKVALTKSGRDALDRV